MLSINTIKPAEGANRSKKRVGRGMGSGHGKTAARGYNGQLSRAGAGIRPGFEGGQMPLHRRLPKRGFSKWRRKDYNEINIGTLQRAIDDKRLDASTPLDVAVLVETGVLRRAKDGLRVLGNGELKAKLTLRVDHATASAKAAIEKAGGSITLIEKKILAADEAKRKKSEAKKKPAVKGGK